MRETTRKLYFHLSLLGGFQDKWKRTQLSSIRCHHLYLNVIIFRLSHLSPCQPVALFGPITCSHLVLSSSYPSTPARELIFSPLLKQKSHDDNEGRRRINMEEGPAIFPCHQSSSWWMIYSDHHRSVPRVLFILVILCFFFFYFLNSIPPHLPSGERGRRRSPWPQKPNKRKHIQHTCFGHTRWMLAHYFTRHATGIRIVVVTSIVVLRMCVWQTDSEGTNKLRE